MEYRTKLILVFSCITFASISISYYLGAQSSSQTDKQSIQSLMSPKNFEELDNLDRQFEKQQQDFTNRLSKVQNQIKTTKLNLGLKETDINVESVEIKQKMQELE